MDYPHAIRITRAADNSGGAVVQDEDTGAVIADVGDVDVVVYDGRADVQDDGRGVPLGADGRPQFTSNARAFLEDEDAIYDVRTGDVVVVTYTRETGETFTRDGEVTNVREIDATLFLSWL